MNSILKSLLIAALITGSPNASAAGEHSLTIAFLYNFLKLTEWPEGTVPNDVTICVTESAAFGDELDDVVGRPVQDKNVAVKRIKVGENLNGCQLFFIPREDKPQVILDWLEAAKNTATLTVSNADTFLDMGGMVALIKDNDRLQFEVNLEPVNLSNIKLSSQMLKIARQVRGN